ncbi:fucolectin-like [Mytilus edulis]|uniref:fucolectin-like n=1 Tax=Mytilus edulis TaxID=6550 RepID=UPI0039F07752
MVDLTAKSLRSSESADANIALKKPTKLSSIYDPKIHEGYHYACCNSSYAVDGDKLDSTAHGFICAHSDSVANQRSWWAVDLQNVYDINAVEIFGRTDCCSECYI